MCQFQHDIFEALDDKKYAEDKEKKASTKEIDDTVNDKNSINTEKDIYCKICKIDIPAGKKKFLYEKCEYNVCKTCSKTSLVEEDWFMCLACQ